MDINWGDAPSWVAALLALGAVWFAASAKRQARRSADSAERSEGTAHEAKEAAKRSADAAERSADAAEEEIELLRNAQPPWEVEPTTGSRYRLTKRLEDAHNVTVNGDAVIGTAEWESVGEDEFVSFVLGRAGGDSPQVTITWDRPPQEGGERRTFRFEL